MPFPDDEFQVVYSVAAMQHIEKHVAFLLFEELHRVLAPGGHAIIHLLAVDHIPRAIPSYHDECLNHVHNVPTHWHHYYSFDELFVLFSRVIGVSDLDIVTDDDASSFLIHFSKETGNRFRRQELPALTFLGRLQSPTARPLSATTLAPASPPESLRAWARRHTPDSIVRVVRDLRNLARSSDGPAR